jgi:hypothetical protein
MSSRSRPVSPVEFLSDANLWQLPLRRRRHVLASGDSITIPKIRVQVAGEGRAGYWTDTATWFDLVVDGTTPVARPQNHGHKNP